MKNKSVSQSALIGLFVVLTFVVCNLPALGQNCPQNGTCWTDTSGDWFTGTNWSNGVPTSSLDAYISNTGKAQVNSSGATSRTLTLGLNATDSGAVLVDGTNNINPGSLVVPPDCPDISGVLGVIYVGSSGTGAMSITNGGTVTSEAGYIAEYSGSNGSVTVDGANANGSSTWTISTTCGNPAQLIIGGDLNGAGGTGLLKVTNGGIVTASNQIHRVPLIVRTSGTVTGNGTIIATGTFSSQMIIEGTLAPSGQLNIGTDAIESDLDLLGSATTQCNVTPTSNDSVNVKSGPAQLDGRLSVTMTGDFSSAPTRYTLLHAGAGLLGTRFATYSFEYPTNQGWTPQITYDYTGGNVYLDRVYNLLP